MQECNAHQRLQSCSVQNLISQPASYASLNVTHPRRAVYAAVKCQRLCRGKKPKRSRRKQMTPEINCARGFEGGAGFRNSRSRGGESKRPRAQGGWSSSAETAHQSPTKPNQTKPNQTKPNQTKPNQTKPNQEVGEGWRLGVCGLTPRLWADQSPIANGFCGD
jgi:hypothetical protein